MATPRNQSVQKAFAMLRSFRGPDEWVSNAELSRRAQLSEAAGHRLIRTLEEIGVVVRNTRGCYRPGLLLASLSKNVDVGDLVRNTSQKVLNDLASHVGAIVHVGVLENGMVTYAAKVGDENRVSVHSRVGSQQEAYCSALGKVLLAALPDDELEDFLHDGEFVALTPRTITDIMHLRSELQMVRKRGYAVDDCEVSPSLCCVGTPIKDVNNQTVAAISVTDTAVRMTESRRNEIRDILFTAAADIARKMYPCYNSSRI
jgi:DNA-binding IclR family transcriptional regulator